MELQSHGIGVSVVDAVAANQFLRSDYYKLNNVVVHVIAGLFDEKTFFSLSLHQIKLLILGYKEIRRGEIFKAAHNSKITHNLMWLSDNLSTVIRDFDIVAFDTLAVKQLNLQDYAVDSNPYYMGEDGTTTFYIDAVAGEYALSSTSTERYPITDSIISMFNNIRRNQNLPVYGEK